MAFAVGPGDLGAWLEVGGVDEFVQLGEIVGMLVRRLVTLDVAIGGLEIKHSDVVTCPNECGLNPLFFDLACNRIASEDVVALLDLLDRLCGVMVARVLADCGDASSVGSLIA